MKRLDAVLLKVYLYGMPLVIAYALFIAQYSLETATQAGGYIEEIYNLGGLVFGSWMTLSIYLSIRLMISEYFREKVLAKLTFIKERDEREVQLTGKAAKTTLLTTLAILIFLFFLSCFQVSVSKLPPEQAIEGKTKTLSLGLNFNILEYQQEKTKEDTLGEEIIAYNGLPISSSTVIMGLIIWQIVAYNYTMRRQMK